MLPFAKTLIVDVGGRSTRVGYAGDFSPFYETLTGEISADQNAARIKVARLFAKQHEVDSVIVVAGDDEEGRYEVATSLLDNLVCNSVVFISAAVCELFGHGKTSGTVVHLGGGVASVSVVQQGVVSERCVMPHSGEALVREVSAALGCDLNSATELIETVNLEEAASLEEIKGTAKDTLQTFINSVYLQLDKAVAMRKQYGFKRTASSGCIVLAGGLFRNRSIISLCKRHLLSVHGESVAESLLSDTAVDATFTGASLFGSNNLSKALFITRADLQRHGPDSIALRALRH